MSTTRIHWLCFVISFCASVFAADSKHDAKPVVIPTPDSVFGFAPGADYHLADYEQVTKYFQALAAASPRIKLQQIGKSGYGREMFVAIISKIGRAHV